MRDRHLWGAFQVLQGMGEGRELQLATGRSIARLHGTHTAVRREYSFWNSLLVGLKTGRESRNTRKGLIKRTISSQGSGLAREKVKTEKKGTGRGSRASATVGEGLIEGPGSLKKNWS